MNYSKYLLMVLFSVNHLHGAAASSETPKATAHAKKVAAAKAKVAAANGMITVKFLNAGNGSALGSQEFSANTELTAIKEVAQKLSTASKVRLEVSTLDPAKAKNQLEDTFGFRRTDKYAFLSQVPHRTGELNIRHMLVHILQPSNNQLTTVAESACSVSAAAATSATAATTTLAVAPSQTAASAAAMAAQSAPHTQTTITAFSASAASGKKRSSLLHSFLAKKAGSNSGKSNDSKKDVPVKK